MLNLGGLLGGGGQKSYVPNTPLLPATRIDDAGLDDITRRRRLLEEVRRGRESFRRDPSTNSGSDGGINLPGS